MFPPIAEALMDVTVSRELGASPTGDPVADEISLAELLSKNDAGVGAGVGAIDIESSAAHRLYEYETGARWLGKYRPNFPREVGRYPAVRPLQPALCRGARQRARYSAGGMPSLLAK